MNFVSFRVWASFLPVRSQGSDELLPVDQSVVVVEQVRDGFHFEFRSVEFWKKKQSEKVFRIFLKLGTEMKLTRFDDSVGEIVPRNQTIVVLVHFSEQVG